MAKNEIIDVLCFGSEVGRIGLDEEAKKSFFQYNPNYLAGNWDLFPKTGIVRRIPQKQIFRQFNNETFRGLLPQIADSLPDLFGNIVFKAWLEGSNKDFKHISVIEQLAYVANRGMGALEYRPSKVIPSDATIDLNEITEVLKKVILNKKNTASEKLSSEALLNIFKIGSSAGGARPKVLISENKKTGVVIPGDLEYSEAYEHYLVKLSVDEEIGYSRELLEFCYYLTATQLGIKMMPSKLIEEKHFASLRFDRQGGKKQHVLTATGLTGWDFKNPSVSSYENLFDLALFLKIPHSEIEQLYKRMVFNVLFCNADDHLKNHSFIYDEIENKWNLSPAYDLTYSLNPLINYNRTSRALSINNKRMNIEWADLQQMAETYTIDNAKGVVLETQEAVGFWKEKAMDLDLPLKVVEGIVGQFKKLSA